MLTETGVTSHRGHFNRTFIAMHVHNILKVRYPAIKNVLYGFFYCGVVIVMSSK